MPSGPPECGPTRCNAVFLGQMHIKAYTIYGVAHKLKSGYNGKAVLHLALFFCTLLNTRDGLLNELRLRNIKLFEFSFIESYVKNVFVFPLTSGTRRLNSSSLSDISAAPFSGNFVSISSISGNLNCATVERSQECA